MTPAIELRRVRKNFGETEVIRGASMTVHDGERVAIIGPNGAGKSTLFNLISGILSPTGGEILLNGESIAGQSPYQIARRGLSRSFQITNIFPSLSVFDNLASSVLWALGCRYAAWGFVYRRGEVNRRVEQLLDMLGLTERQRDMASTLTYAEQRALEIGLTMASDSPVILLDEPTAGMSTSETEKFIELIRRVSVNKTLLMVEHDMSVVFGLADRIAVLVWGEVIAIDRPCLIRSNPQVQEAYLGTEIDANVSIAGHPAESDAGALSA